MADISGIQEGFLCPICHKDLRSPNTLVAHFQELHSEEQDILKTIKDLCGKAKKKILKLDEPDLESFKKELALESYFLEYSEPQEEGYCRSYTYEFKAARRDRLDHRTTETNKLIIRLDRLLRFDKTDRKHQEQEIVAWLDGSTVSRCPSCAASFNITRRQHHCRLCGSIMCNTCSYFLSYDVAQTIVAPVHNVDIKGREWEQGSKENDVLRICTHCLNMLETRRRVQIDQMIQPVICQLYSHLQTLKSQTQSSVDLYMKMYNSLSAGETTYQMQDVQALRGTLAKKSEALDVLSKKIASLPVDPEFSKVNALQNSIRRATSHYIKDVLLTLPVPPSLQELERIKRERSLRFHYNEQVPNQNKVSMKKVTVTTGWSAAAASALSEDIVGGEEDPLIVQMNLVRDYIVQARKAKRFEEVASLQENLNMLKEAYKKQNNQTSNC